MAFRSSLLLLNILLLSAGVLSDIVFQFDNQCTYSIWLASSSPIGDADPEKPPETLEVLTMPDSWSGSLWARTKCAATGPHFSCQTGDCGSDEVACESRPPTFPVTLLNFNISEGVVHYELSLKHGFNIPVRIEPLGGLLLDGGTGQCPVVDCVKDLAAVCPGALVATNKDGAYVGCYSACDALKQPQYCCETGCQPDQYSATFKGVCAKAHVFPGDNSPPVYGCAGFSAIKMTFCPF